MIQSSELIALEKDLNGYRSNLRVSDCGWVFGPHKWTVEHVKKEVRAGRMSLRNAKERRLQSVKSSLRRAMERYESNQLSDNGLAQVCAEYRRKRAIELQMSSVLIGRDR